VPFSCIKKDLVNHGKGRLIGAIRRPAVVAFICLWWALPKRNSWAGLVWGLVHFFAIDGCARRGKKGVVLNPLFVRYVEVGFYVAFYVLRALL